MKIKTKKGAASIYMVVVCALLFSVITAGFIVLMVNEVSKSGENTLSQDAYQSSLNGIEDTKVAIQKYYACLGNYSTESSDRCDEIKNAMGDIISAHNTIHSGEGSEDYTGCSDSIRNLAQILYDDDTSYFDGDSGGILIKETVDGGDTVTQAYTCIDVDINPSDYLATLNQSSPQRLIPLSASSGDGNDDVEYVKISWYSTSNLGQSNRVFNNITSDNKPIFKPTTDGDGASLPPVLSVQLYQAPKKFNLSDLNSSTELGSSLNNRGSFWLVPSNLDSEPKTQNVISGYKTKYYNRYGLGNNILNFDAFTDSNSHANGVYHEGFPVRCAKDATEDALSNGYLCSTFIQIPKVSSSSEERSDEFGTFLLSLSLPYQQPDTDIKVEMYNTVSADSTPLSFSQVQIAIDSTGRANNVYSRTETRVEFYDSNFPFPDYAMTLGGDGDGTLQKTFSVTGAQSLCWSLNSGNSPSSGEVEQCRL